MDCPLSLLQSMLSSKDTGWLSLLAATGHGWVAWARGRGGAVAVLIGALATWPWTWHLLVQSVAWSLPLPSRRLFGRSADGLCFYQHVQCAAEPHEENCVHCFLPRGLVRMTTRTLPFWGNGKPGAGSWA